MTRSRSILLSSFAWLVLLASLRMFLPNAVAGKNQTRSALDLASDSAWQASADSGSFRPIIVPGGGWNSDWQPTPRMRPLTRHEEPDEAGLKNDPRGGARARPDMGQYNRHQPDRPVVVWDHVTYRREVTIPADWAGRVIQLEFGGVNYGAAIFLDGQKVGGHDGPNTPFVVDVTGVARPGKTHRLEVTAYHSRHYNVEGMCQVPVGFDYEYWRAMHDPGWTSKTAYGIVRYIRLTSLPLQHVQDVFVRTSVKRDELSFEVMLRNAGNRPADLTLTAALSSWNKSPWKYSSIPSRSVTIPAHGETNLVIQGILWGLGPRSYWWPNIPFQETYLAQLHLLHLGLEKDGKIIAERTQRFGFVEHEEGPYYYTVNGVRVNGFGDGTAEPQLSEFDAYAELLAYKTEDACRETWRRFLRLGLNCNRIHQSTPTDLMMDAADEVGFMLIPETGLRGCHNQDWNLPNFSRAIREMILHARNHPSIARFSLMNEMPYDNKAWSALIDAGAEANPDRPLIIEDNCVGRVFPLTRTRFDGARGHAYAMAHYVDFPRPCRFMFGLGEILTETDGIPNFSVQAMNMRVSDLAYFAPWSLINYWPNLVEGGSHARHGWKANNHMDRVENVDGWNSPIIRLLQRSLSPYLVQDLGVLEENPGAPRKLGDGKAEWPYQLPVVIGGRTVERRVEVFNGGLFGNELTIIWSAHWDRANGPPAVGTGKIICSIEPGFHATKTISFTVPAPQREERELYLVLESQVDGKAVFRDNTHRLKVLAQGAPASAKFLGADDVTRGNWQGNYGADGYELEAKETKLPGYAKLEWTSGELWKYDMATDDLRALRFFVDPTVNTGRDRVAAVRFGGEISFTLKVGPSARRVSLYFLDYDDNGRSQSIEISDPITHELFDRRLMSNFAQGRYMTWEVQGAVRVAIRRLSGANATVSGVFLDPVQAK